MCGICGQFNFARKEHVDPALVQRMTRTLSHRGPDDEGYFTHANIGLGFRRLAIIDLAGGHQPMTDSQSLVHVVFNGEIYNFHALRRELQGYGHIFRTNSDTEVLVHGYKQWGDNLFARLNGMFGLAIWDSVRKRLILARDPLGIKLVYYTVRDGQLLFGSEIRPLLVALKVKPSVDLTGLTLFLSHRYTPSPYTILNGVKKLAPGTILIAEQGVQPHTVRWWNHSPTQLDPAPMTEVARDQLLDLYRKAVRRQLVSDVPVGLLLSGGIDSALLLALMEEVHHGWNTYTVGYGDSFVDDELHQAMQTANAFNVPHAQVRIDKATFEATLTQVVSALEEPVATSSIVPMHHVCQRARQDVKVALMGQGPDELFGGYTRHLGVAYGQYWRNMPETIRNIASVIARLSPRSESIRRGLYALAATPRMERYRRVLSLIDDATVIQLLKPEYREESSLTCAKLCWRDLESLLGNTDELGGLQVLELRSTLPDELLMYADKLSMAHGLEIRVPFLDREIVEYVERIPANLKIRCGLRKYLHRCVARSYLPRGILVRKKRGFASNVVDAWFRASLAGKSDVMLRDSKSHLYTYLDSASVNALLDNHKAGKADNHKILFSLVVLEEVLRLHNTI